MLSEEAEPHGLQVSWIKVNVQVFGDIHDTTIESILVSGKNVELTQTFTFLGSVIHSSTTCKLEVNRRLRRAWSAMNSLDEGGCAADTCAKRLPFFLYSCDTWTLTGGLETEGLWKYVALPIPWLPVAC